MSCGACSISGDRPALVESVRVERITPPKSLMQPCAEPQGVIITNADLVGQLGSTRAALASCAAQVDATRKWIDGQPPGEPST